LSVYPLGCFLDYLLNVFVFDDFLDVGAVVHTFENSVVAVVF